MSKLIRETTIKWSPFSTRHLAYIRKALCSKINIAEGAIRSGKTIDNCYIAYRYLEHCEDRIHLATGSVLRNAKLNIGDCNGFGLEHLFRGRCRWGKYKDNDALYIYTKTGEKIVVFAGGGRADSYKGILGNSYGLWIATEINEHYDDEDSQISFIRVAMGRQIAAHEYKILWDLNPSNPNAAIYSKYIDKYREEGICNYEKFTLYDNASLSEERIKEIEQRYIPGTIWHTRDILGERCIAEGLIYEVFANNWRSYLIDKGALPQFGKIVAAVDWGGNGSAHAFAATGITADYSRVVSLASESWDALGTDADFIAKKFTAFCERVEKKYGRITEAYADSAEQILRNHLNLRGPIKLKNALKTGINDRIDLMALLLAQRRWFYTEDCDTLKKALMEARWDPKHPDERLDDGTSPIDPLDAHEYSIERYGKVLSR